MKRRDLLKFSTAVVGTSAAPFYLAANASGEHPSQSNSSFQLIPSKKIPGNMALGRVYFDDKNNRQIDEILQDGNAIFSENCPEWFFSSQDMFVNTTLSDEIDGEYLLFIRKAEGLVSIACVIYKQEQLTLLNTLDSTTLSEFLRYFPEKAQYHSSYTTAEAQHLLLVCDNQLASFSLDKNSEFQLDFLLNEANIPVPNLDIDPSLLIAKGILQGPFYNFTGDHKNNYIFVSKDYGHLFYEVDAKGFHFIAQIRPEESVVTNTDGTWNWQFDFRDTYRVCLQHVWEHPILSYLTKNELVFFSFVKNHEAYDIVYVTHTPIGTPLGSNDITFSNRIAMHALPALNHPDTPDLLFFSCPQRGWTLLQINQSRNGFSLKELTSRSIDEITEDDQQGSQNPHCFQKGDLAFSAFVNPTQKKRDRLILKHAENPSNTAMSSQMSQQYCIHHMSSDGNYFKIFPNVQVNFAAATQESLGDFDQTTVSVEKISNFAAADNSIDQEIKEALNDVKDIDSRALREKALGSHLVTLFFQENDHLENLLNSGLNYSESIREEFLESPLIQSSFFNDSDRENFVQGWKEQINQISPWTALNQAYEETKGIDSSSEMFAQFGSHAAENFYHGLSQPSAANENWLDGIDHAILTAQTSEHFFKGDEELKTYFKAGWESKINELLSSHPSEHHSLSGGAIAGIVIGSVVGTMLLLCRAGYHCVNSGSDGCGACLFRFYLCYKFLI